MQPLFSVLTVTLNCVTDAVSTARSLLSQNTDNYEYIVKDGGSQDGTVERLRDLGVNVYVQPDNGIYDAMNQAVELSSGRYVHFLNAGDIYASPDALQNISRLLGDEPLPEIIFTFYVKKDSQARITFPSQISQFYLFRKTVCHQAVFVKKSVFEEGNFFNTNFKSISDHEFLLRCLISQNRSYRVIPVTSVIYQGGGFSTTWPIVKEAREDLKELRKLYFPAPVFLIFTFLHEATLWRCRRWIMLHCRFPKALRLYHYISNYFDKL